jgi:acyl carrier protein
MSDVFEKTRGIIAQITHTSESAIQPETLLKEIKADSLHWLQIIVRAEEVLDIEIDFEKMKTFTSIKDIIDYIEGLE